MLTGVPAFCNQKIDKMCWMILQDTIVDPPCISKTYRHLISHLRDSNPQTRHGAGTGDIEEIKARPFFASFVWDDVLSKKVKPECVPKISGLTIPTTWMRHLRVSRQPIHLWNYPN
jgi:hypothetical protein